MVGMRQVLKKSARLLLILVILASAIGTGLYFVGVFYGDRVKQLFVDELNKRITIELKVETIQFDVFNNFPYASVRFINVISRDPLQPNKLPLIKAGEISLIFNFYDLIRKNYKIERLMLKDAFVNLEISEEGVPNYDVYKKPDDSRNDSFELGLQNFILRNVEIAYLNFPSDQDFLLHVRKGEFKGNYSVDKLDFLFGGHVYTTYLKSGNTTILRDKELEMRLDLIYDYLSENLTARMGTIKSNRMQFEITGMIGTNEQNQNLNLKIISGKSSLASYLEMIPSEFLKPLADYKLTGSAAFEATVRGTFAGKNVPELIVDFYLENGKILHPGSGFQMENVTFAGNFNNGGKRDEKYYSVALRNIKANIRGGAVSGQLAIRDFNRPEVTVHMTSALDLRQLKSVYPIDYLKSIDGKLELNISFTNRLKDFRGFTMEDFLSSKTTGTMSFHDMNFTVKETLLSFSDFNGKFRFSNRDLVIDSFSGKVSDNDFNMTGYFRNILAYAFRPDEKLYIQANLNSQYINLDQLLAYKEHPDNAPYYFNLSDRLNYDMNVEIESFRFRKFNGQKVSGKFSQNNKKFMVREGSVKTMDGYITIAGAIDGKNEKNYLVTCDAALNEVDIRKLFTEFGNFGQNNLTDNHLRGKITSRVYYHSTLTPALYVNPASVYCLADITVYDGELIRYKPLYALSRFVKQEELEHIKFSTLKNNIRIENRVVYIPQMEINSNTLNINLFGKHDFDNITDYHIQLRLSELLVRKPKESEQIPGIFEKEGEGGKARLFLSMTGPAENPAIRYDTQEVRKKIAIDMSKEKDNLKEILREEFKWASGQKKEQETKPENSSYTGNSSPDFVFDFDEIKKDSVAKKPTLENIRVKKSTEKKAEKEFTIKWDEE